MPLLFYGYNGTLLCHNYGTEMKHLILIVLLFLLFSSCDSEAPITSPVSPPPGTVSLTFDKTTIPSDVASIAVVLSRTGYDSLKKLITVASDSAAETLFERVPVGPWKLEINAYDQTRTVKYSGTTTVTVAEGTVTAVSIILQPVTTGVGSVKISIIWGSAPPIDWSRWTHHAANPVLIKGEKIFEKHGAAQPFLFSDNGVWKMTFLSIGIDTAMNNRLIGSVGLASSTNGGESWVKHFAPILTVGDSSWNNYSIAPGPVFKTNGWYTMLYTGATSSQQYSIGVAISSDGQTWQKLPNPLFTPTGTWDIHMNAGDVIRVNGTYYFYFSCRSNNVHDLSIGLATSTDGITWKRHGNGPVLTVSQSWERNGVYFPSVVHENGLFTMMYSDAPDFSSPSFGIATSADGIHWTKNSKNPVIVKTSQHHSWAPDEISYPHLKKINGVYRAYYTGFDWSDPYNPQWKIGYASLQQ